MGSAALSRHRWLSLLLLFGAASVVAVGLRQLPDPPAAAVDEPDDFEGRFSVRPIGANGAITEEVELTLETGWSVPSGLHLHEEAAQTAAQPVTLSEGDPTSGGNTASPTVPGRSSFVARSKAKLPSG